MKKKDLVNDDNINNAFVYNTVPRDSVLFFTGCEVQEDGLWVKSTKAKLNGIFHNIRYKRNAKKPELFRPEN